ncbi:hypothetical protein ACK323_20535 [Aeromonas enteropelogenes]|uniref:hypothetical protein n=1 Tax=Aeromonas TaxID=642 RepID=UPI0015E6ED26|nr:hypothetical protein [Aeromonas veronii]
MSDPNSAVETIWTTRDILYAIGIGISLFFSIISTIISLNSLSNAKKRDLNSFGDSETKTFESIAKVEEEFAVFNAEIIKEKENFEKDPSNSGKEFTLSVAQAQLNELRACAVLNAYEIACQRYLDGKLDKTRFSKTYSARLSKVCSHAVYKPLIYNGGHEYSAIKKVNNALNDKEQ